MYGTVISGNKNNRGNGLSENIEIEEVSTSSKAFLEKSSSSNVTSSSSSSSSPSFFIWFFDESKPVFPVINHRFCLDYFFHHVAWIFSLIIAIWAAAAAFLAVGAMDYLYYVAAIAAFGVGVIWYGEWALSERLHSASFVFLCSTWWFMIGLLWSATAALVHIQSAQQTVEDQWYVMQSQIIIPFTSQLDQKLQIQSFATAIFAISFITVLMFILPLTEAWRALGGVMRFSRLKFSVQIIDFVPMFAAAVGTATFGLYSANLSTFATLEGPAILLWQSAAALFTIVALCGSFTARAVWGPSFLQHAIHCISLTPLGFIQFVISLELFSRATEVDGYVSQRWPQRIQYLVPPRFAARNYEKYVTACTGTMLESASAGIILSFLILCSVALNMHLGNVLLFTSGPDQKLSLHETQVGEDALQSYTETQQRRGVLRNTSLYIDEERTEKSDFQSTPLSPYNKRPGASGIRTELTPLSKSRVESATRVVGPTLGGGLSTKDSRNAIAAVISEDEAERRRRRREELSKLVSNERFIAYKKDAILMMIYERELEELRSSVSIPTFGTLIRAGKYYCREAYEQNFMCLVLSFVAFIIALGSIAGGLQESSESSRCLGLANAATRTISVSLFIESGGSNLKQADIILKNLYPYGGLEIDVQHVPILGPVPKNNTVVLTLSAWALQDSDLPSYDQLYSMYNASGFEDEHDDDTGGFTSVVASADPPSDALKKCLGMRMRFAGEAGLMRVVLKTYQAMVNVTGNFDDLKTNAVAPRAYQTLKIDTDSGPIVAGNGYVDALGLDPVSGFAPSTVITSKTGDVYLTTFTSSGLSVTTGGSIATATVGSFSASNCQAVCGDVNLTATGNGRISIAQAFGGYNANVRTDHGAIIAANTGMIIGGTMRIESIDGPITMSNFLQAYNNETYVTSGGKISATVVITNRIYITGKGEADVSILELFAGAPAPGEGLFNPPIYGNFSDPLAYVSVDRGDITILGIGGSPASSAYANIMSMFLYATVGKVKVQANGGGLNGNYTVRSARGQAIVELDGRPGPLTGVLGTGSLGKNKIYVFSDTGNVQMSLLPSPL
jgi:hypothetical protein